jgi:hypothetical protein
MQGLVSPLCNKHQDRTEAYSVVGYFDHVSQRWEYSTKFAVYGTRFLIKDKDKHSPAKAPKMEVARMFYSQLHSQ